VLSQANSNAAGRHDTREAWYKAPEQFDPEEYGDARYAVHHSVTHISATACLSTQCATLCGCARLLNCTPYAGVPRVLRRDVYIARLHSAEERVDIWAWGCVFLEMAVGQHPWARTAPDKKHPRGVRAALHAAPDAECLQAAAVFACLLSGPLRGWV